MPYFFYPFGVDGDLATIPLPTQPSGSISYQQGYGPDYELDLLTNPDAIPIGRTTMNQLFNDITTDLQLYYQTGVPPFITTADNQGTPFPYPIYARTRYMNVVYENQVAGNTATPGTDDSWLNISGPVSSLIDYFSGFLTSDNGTNMTFGPGTCSNSSNTVTIVSPTPFTKNMTSVWAPGSGNGGVPSGVTLMNNMDYYDFVIAKADGTVDFGLDDNLSATNLLADAAADGFIHFRRIRAHLTQLSATNIETMYQVGRNFYFQTVRQDVAAPVIVPGPNEYVVTASLPTLINVEAITKFIGDSGAAPAIAKAYPTASGVVPVTPGDNIFFFFGLTASQGFGDTRIYCTDGTYQISYNGGFGNFVMIGLGWADYLDN